jgi:hypothetical protein
MLILAAIFITNYEHCNQQVYEAANQACRKDYAWWEYSGAWVALFTVILTASTALLWRVTRQAVSETRRIGESQVRAYVTIKSAAIYFSGEDGMPWVDIIASNNGQSPARSFAWRPQIRFYADLEKGTGDRPESGSWWEKPGIDVAANGETEPHGLMFVVPDIMVGRYVAQCKSKPERVAVAVCIDFSYLDVFGRRFTEAAYFAGVAERGDPEENKREIFPANNSAWYCHLNRIGRTDLWDFHPDDEPDYSEVG